MAGGGRYYYVSSSFPILFPCYVQDGQTPLFVAATEGHVRVAQLLLSRGADVTHQTKVRLSLLVPKIMLLQLTRYTTAHLITITRKYDYSLVNTFLCNWIAAGMLMHTPLTMRLLLYLQRVL